MHNPIPQVITDFIQQNHVVNLACQADSSLWAASCFYAFDEKHFRLIILTDRKTLHGQLMLKNSTIVGTIAAQPTDIQKIEGIQFRAIATLLPREKQNEALTLYYKRHKYVEKMQSDVWEICFEYIKHTSNKIQFAQKTEWFSFYH